MRKNKRIISLFLLLLMIINTVSSYALLPPPDYTEGNNAGGTISTDVNVNIEGQGNQGSQGEGGNTNPGNPENPDTLYKYVITYHYDESVEVQRGEGKKNAIIPYSLETPKTYAGHNWVLDSFQVSRFISDDESCNTAEIYYTVDDKNSSGNSIPGGDGIPDKYQNDGSLNDPLNLYRYDVTYNYKENNVGSHQEHIMGQGTLGSMIPYQQTQTRSYNGSSYSFESINVQSATVTPIVENNKVQLTYELLSENDDVPEAPATEFIITLDPANNGKIETQHVAEGNTVVKPADPSKEGYKFLYWAEIISTEGKVKYQEYDFSTPINGNKALVAQYELNSELVEYKVLHYKQDLTVGYTISDTEVLTGTSGEVVTATSKNYEGFIFDENKSSLFLTLTKGEDNTLNLYYNRDNVVVTFNPNNGCDSWEETIKYGSNVNKPVIDPEKAEHDFVGWFNGDSSMNFTLPVTSNIVLTARYQLTPRDVKYTVEHYQQNLENDEYTLKDSEELTQKENKKVTAQAKPYIGFHENTAHADRVPEGIVKYGEAQITLKLYYDRDVHNISIDPNNGQPVTELQVKYGEVLTKPEDPKNGENEFSGWTDGDGVPVNWDTPVSGDLVIKASWTNPNTKLYGYIVKSYFDKEIETIEGKLPVDTEIPYSKAANRVFKDHNYTLVNKNVLSEKIIKDESQNVVTLYYELDDIGKDKGIAGGDGTPDKYQVTINYKAVFGTVSNPHVVVNKYTDSKLSETGKAILTNEDMPNVKANYGYSNGTWDKTPIVGIEVKDGDTFTITYKRIPTYDNTDSIYYPPYKPTNPQKPSTPSDEDGEIVDIPNENIPLDEIVQLDKDNHNAYVFGFPDGTVKPLANITRAEVVQMIVRLMTDEYRTYYYTTTNSFTDVASDKWYNEAVSIAAYAEIIKGNGDGTFRPTNNITRAEFATIASRFFKGYNLEENKTSFNDISGHWAENAIKSVASMGWVEGYGDGTFRPNSYITRAEVVTILNRILHRTPVKDNMLPDMKTWPDNSKDAWYYEAIQEATNSHEFKMEDSKEVWTKLTKQQ